MKVKLPKLPKFLTNRKKKLRASTARRPLRIAATADYDELAEPNMKLSRALLIVLLLHVVAVSGIIAFNAIKTRQGPNIGPAPRASATEEASADKPAAATEANLQTRDATHHDEKAPRAIAVKSNHKSGGPVDSGKTYTVAKGDNPAGIARKLKVSYDDLLALNHVDDPHKLQIGQKLLVPVKTAKPKKSDE